MGLDCSCEDHMVNTPVIGLTISTTLLLAVCLYLYVRWLVTAFISLASILDGSLRPQCRLLQGTQKTPRSVSLTSRLGHLCRIDSFTYLQVRKTKTGNLNHNAFQLQKKGEDVEAQNQRGEDVKKPAPPQPPLLPVRPTPQNYIRILLFFLHLFFLNEESQSSSPPTFHNHWSWSPHLRFARSRCPPVPPCHTEGSSLWPHWAGEPCDKLVEPAWLWEYWGTK